MQQHQLELDHKNHISHYKNVSQMQLRPGNQFQVPRLPSGWTMARCCCYKIWFYERRALSSFARQVNAAPSLRCRLREGEGWNCSAVSLSSVPFDGQVTMILMLFMTGTQQPYGHDGIMAMVVGIKTVLCRICA